MKKIPLILTLCSAVLLCACNSGKNESNEISLSENAVLVTEVTTEETTQTEETTETTETTAETTTTSKTTTESAETTTTTESDTTEENSDIPDGEFEIVIEDNENSEFAESESNDAPQAEENQSEESYIELPFVPVE